MASEGLKLSDIYLESFIDFHFAYKEEKHTFYALKGGRGSAKSSHISIELILDLMANPVNAIVVRRYANTLEDSVFEQLLWAIDKLGVSHKWKIKKSPLKLVYVPRGNEIIFRGADDPGKIKSIKKSSFPIARLWVEELDEFKMEEDVSKVSNSIIREQLPKGHSYKMLFSYNPPKRKQSWINKKFSNSLAPEHYFIHHSDYKGNKFMSEEFLKEAEHHREINPARYRWEYLGEPIGSGVVPFANVEYTRISDEMVESFNNIKQGIDFGYAVDPVHFGRWHYDKTRRTLYAIAEIHEVKLSNRELARKIQKLRYDDYVIICDSAEPKSIDELREWGLKVRSAKKGPGSVEFGEKWLDDLERIVIDPKRTPNIAREFEMIDYEVDRFGEVKSKLTDKDNHSIDALRYALESDMPMKKHVASLNAKIIRG